ncbi:MAG: transposase [Sulfuricella sp.]|nr:transposase [Sulfuricella sp.]
MPYTDLLKGRASLPGQTYLVTAVTHGRARRFEDFGNARLLVAEMRLLDETKVVQSLAWVIMPDHLHWLLALGEGSKLGDAMRLLKGRSARTINHRSRENGAVWQRGYHEHALRSEEDIVDIARYIVANPLRAGLVARLADYPLWDAMWL